MLISSIYAPRPFSLHLRETDHNTQDPIRPSSQATYGHLRWEGSDVTLRQTFSLAAVAMVVKGEKKKREYRFTFTSTPLAHCLFSIDTRP
ncbi:hypothetical protein TNCV_3616401 [Trichonephila clavipes]|nr:hypothetical protein TNCV_3616401 [Trichonephila clavipes]